jgi:hypothetical protein
MERLKLYFELKPRYKKYIDDLIFKYPELTDSIVISRSKIIEYRKLTKSVHPTFITKYPIPGHRGIYFFPNPNLEVLPSLDTFNIVLSKVNMKEIEEFRQELIDAGFAL